MELYLLRHAIAVQRGTPGYEDRDDERPLTKDGIKKMKRAAKGIQQLETTFDRILTSPILRARHTADILARKMKLKKLIEEADELGNAFTCEAALERIKRADDAQRIVLVGHEPDFSELANFLLINGFAMQIDFKKGGLMRIDFDGEVSAGKGTLVYLLEPSQLSAMAD